jgi:transcriptional regulator with XRE-family HTH domain
MVRIASKPKPRPRRPGEPVVIPPAKGELDVRAIRLGARRAIGATQETFAKAIGVRVKTIRNWEQRRREPTGPARVLLALVARDPGLVFEVMNSQQGEEVSGVPQAEEVSEDPSWWNDS